MKSYFYKLVPLEFNVFTSAELIRNIIRAVLLFNQFISSDFFQLIVLID